MTPEQLLALGPSVTAMFVALVSTTLEYEADPTFENEATGSSSPSLPRLGF